MHKSLLPNQYLIPLQKFLENKRHQELLPLAKYLWSLTASAA